MAKVNISIDDDLLKRLDDYADNNYSSRSGVISFALIDYLNSREIFTAVNKLNLALDKVSKNGSIDEQTLQELSDFRDTCAFITNLGRK